jgi:hypothetical protein
MEDQNQQNPEDVVAFDVPMFIRLLEFAREDATDDEALHKATDKIIELCQDGQVLTMDQYDEVVAGNIKVDTSGMNAVDDKIEPMDEAKYRWLKIAGLLTEEYDEEENEFDLSEEFDKSPNSAPYSDVLNIFESYEDPETIRDFEIRFEGQDTVSKHDYAKFAHDFIDDQSELDFVMANWISIWDDDIYEKAGLV